ncbi:Serine/threonine-specific protein phosphatase/bis(5-nucleosyl)-tetraphosphatase [Ostreococcus tauri]|uniref:Serine/threonine-protein phosphatase n=1 Tax=Ostreococcus tauri TaxID=70448 RepID=A0A090N465_OSTTA|nr:Serine/threonine-specific protein phosphatase/bis(5-nucleosyl)-tetraphosphatase [Ostreococcus tauri]CEF99328.1 Serine/threonine-specific protein phosphatase/bis(5-nucleosyl)-tetraphosphatase [Ostreococcus tauri]|eukprot:XP_022839769.1 Serine/threonine-specific protein phosphatase/bis(5-nucleosyl)-tetraphosphatase [Ostreococcus tauri]
MLGATFARDGRARGFDDATNARFTTNQRHDGDRAKTTRDDASPGARCGHTLTALRWNQRTKIVCFGGATELEGASASALGDGRGGSPLHGGGRDGTNWVKLSGATSDLRVFDPQGGEWDELKCGGDVPSARAAHGAATVGGMLVVHGGIGPDGLADGDLYVLDLATKDPKWHRVHVKGDGPGQRYAHVLSFVAQRFLVVIGGTDGSKCLGDTWVLDTTTKPYAWSKCNPTGPTPSPRTYASASTRTDGLLLLCGGRGADGMALNDAFGLARHRDGRWEWAEAPGKAPTRRFQHATAFVDTRLHITGGASAGGQLVPEETTMSMLDTSAGGSTGWRECKRDGPKTGLVQDANALVGPRCRHASVSYGPFIFVHGGLRNGALLDDLVVLEEPPEESGTTRAERSREFATLIDPNSLAWRNWLTDTGLAAEILGMHSPRNTRDTFAINTQRDATYSNGSFSSPSSPPEVTLRPLGGSPSSPDSPEGMNANAEQELRHASAQEAAAALDLVARRKFSLGGSDSGSPGGSSVHTPSPGFAGLGSPGDARRTPASEVRLHHRAVVVAAAPYDSESKSTPRGVASMVRQLSIDQFENEARRIGTPGADMYTPGDTPAKLARARRAAELGAQPVHRVVITHLLHPHTWEPSQDRRFFLNAAAINELCDAAEHCFKNEETVLRVNGPAKIFGDLHGQFGDLMRLFAEYGSPSTAGDIAYIDYVFLGDYVDRGAYSLETISLLLALKIEYPNSVHLLRGNHEESDINGLFGFRIECVERLGEAVGDQVWRRFNSLFEWLPLAAVIEDRICCMHGGIGRSVTHLSQINDLKRPLTMENGGVELMDILWSDPTENDGIEGLRPNARGPGLVTFGPDRVRAFCETNGIQMIVRAHECVMDGFERFAQGQLLTVFSATNYCGTANNAGAILVLGRDLTLYPKLIHPLPPIAMESLSPSDRIDDNLWLQDVNRERPPTPPRGRFGQSQPTIGLINPI